MISKQLKKYITTELYKEQLYRNSNNVLVDFYNSNDFFKKIIEPPIPLTTDYEKLDKMLSYKHFEPHKQFIRYNSTINILKIKYNGFILEPFNNFKYLYEYMYKKSSLTDIYNKLVDKYRELNEKKDDLDNHEFDRRLHEQYLYYINEKKLDADSEEEIQNKLEDYSDIISEEIVEEIKDIEKEIYTIKSLMESINDSYTEEDFDNYNEDVESFDRNFDFDFDDADKFISILDSIYKEFD